MSVIARRMFSLHISEIEGEKQCAEPACCAHTLFVSLCCLFYSKNTSLCILRFLRRKFLPACLGAFQQYMEGFREEVHGDLNTSLDYRTDDDAAPPGRELAVDASARIIFQIQCGSSRSGGSKERNSPLLSRELESTTTRWLKQEPFLCKFTTDDSSAGDNGDCRWTLWVRPPTSVPRRCFDQKILSRFL